MGKKGQSKIPCKTQDILRAKVSAAGGAAPLSYGEERNAFGYATARGPLAGLRAAAPAADPGKHWS